MNKITSHQLHEKFSDLKLVRRELPIGLKVSLFVFIHHVKSEHDISRYKITRKQNMKNLGTLLESVSLKYAHSTLTSA